MNRLKSTILQDIYHRSETGDFLRMEDLECTLGLSGTDLRPLLEDLKEILLIVELPEGFQLTPEGRHYCRSRWA